jgi:hypothetical protein
MGRQKHQHHISLVRGHERHLQRDHHCDLAFHNTERRSEPSGHNRGLQQPADHRGRRDI